MTDRSAIMRAVKSRDTGPELLVRKIAHSIRPGYRLNRADIPGKPDIAYIRSKHAIFVHGCFWHGHNCQRGARVPKQNRDYWLAKITRNIDRDQRNLAILTERGWAALVVWECELKDRDAIARRLTHFLGSEPAPTQKCPSP